MANKGNGTMKRGAANALKNSYTTNKSFNRIANNTNMNKNIKQNRQRTKRGSSK